MLRRTLPIALALSALSITASPSLASPSMCVGMTRCGITRLHSAPVRTASTRRIVVVPERSDGSQHGGISLVAGLAVLVR